MLKVSLGNFTNNNPDTFPNFASCFVIILMSTVAPNHRLPLTSFTLFKLFRVGEFITRAVLIN